MRACIIYQFTAYLSFRLIQVPAVGSNNLLRFLLQMKLKRLHDDDTMIQKEGIDSLTVQELQTACQVGVEKSNETHHPKFASEFCRRAV